MAPTPTLAEAFRAQIAHEHGEGLFDSLEDIQFWMKDALGRYMRVNLALLKNYGFDDEGAVLGRTDLELFPPHLAQGYMRDDKAVLAGMRVRDRIELVRRRDGSIGWHVTNKILLRSSDHRVLGTAGITRDLVRGSVAATTAEALQGVVLHMNEHADRPLEKRRYARMIGLSVRSLERRFLGAFGICMLQYQRKLRMQRACQLLVATRDPITRIALAVGYGDHSHFTREFGRIYAIPPREYRERWSSRRP